VNTGDLKIPHLFEKILGFDSNEVPDLSVSLRLASYKL